MNSIFVFATLGVLKNMCAPHTLAFQICGDLQQGIVVPGRLLGRRDDQGRSASSP